MRQGGDGKGSLIPGSDHPYEVGWWRRNSDGIVQTSAQKNPMNSGYMI